MILLPYFCRNSSKLHERACHPPMVRAEKRATWPRPEARCHYPSASALALFAPTTAAFACWILMHAAIRLVDALTATRRTVTNEFRVWILSHEQSRAHFEPYDLAQTPRRDVTAGPRLAYRSEVHSFAQCLLAILAGSCLAAESPNVIAASPSPNAAVDPGPSLRALEVAGFQPALLFSPAGAAVRPLVVAAHGAGGSADWECEYWRRLTRGRAFVLCLQGTPLGGSYAGYYYRDHRALNREFVAAERAARDAEPRILAGSGLYAGFSQGATMGVPILAEHAAAFPYAVLIEGFTSWNVPGGRRFTRAGGRRILIACGSKECAAVGKTSERWLQASGAQVRLGHAAGAGHTPAGAVMELVASALPWLLEGDPRWQE
jgi:hypothetical protein